MGHRVLDSVLLEKGGIEDGSHVRYFTREEEKAIDFRVEELKDGDVKMEEEEVYDTAEDADLFGCCVGSTVGH